MVTWSKKRLLLLAVVVILLVLIIGTIWWRKTHPFTDADHLIAKQLVADIHQSPEKLKEIPEINDKELFERDNDIYMVVTPTPKKSSSEMRYEISKEGFQFPNNAGFWPLYYYSSPYYAQTVPGAWPPSLYSRMHLWNPGFDVTGWSYYLRPGISHVIWPNNYWARNNGSYYYINNR